MLLKYVLGLIVLYGMSKETFDEPDEFPLAMWPDVCKRYIVVAADGITRDDFDIEDFLY